MKPVLGKSWEGGYAFRPFKIRTTDVEFEWGRSHGRTASCNISSIYVAPSSSIDTHSHLDRVSKNVPSSIRKPTPNTHPRNPPERAGAGLQDTLVNGVLQGRKQSDAKGSCSISRRSIWQAATSVIAELMDLAVLSPQLTLLAQQVTSGTTQIENHASRAPAKKTLSYGEFKKTGLFKYRAEVKSEITSEGGPLQGWIRNGGDEEFSL